MLPISHTWMSATNRNITYPRCIDNNFETMLMLMLRLGWWPCCVLFWQLKVPICLLCITTTKSLVNSPTYKTTNHWSAVDAHRDGLSIQIMLLSIILFILIWLYWMSFCMIWTRPCGKAERPNNLALFTLTRLKMMYYAKRYIAPAIHLLMNPYSQATSYYSQMVYFLLKLLFNLH
jgi:hypothetical protein